MSHIQIQSILVTFGVLLVLNGCGSDGDESSNASVPPLTKAAFTQEANSLCERSRVEAIGRASTLAATKTGSKSDLEQKLFLSVMVPAVHKRLDQVRALGVPTGDEDQVEAILQEVEGIIDTAKDNPERFFREQITHQHPLKKAEEMADRYGISDCVQP